MHRGLLLVAVALFLVACGNETSTSSNQAARSLAAASSATLEQSSSKVAIDVSLDSDDAQALGGYRAEGAFDYAHNRGRMTVDLGQLPVAAGTDSGNVEVIFDRQVIYMKLPGLQESAPIGKPWVRIDIEEMQRQSGVSGQFDAFGQADPSQYLQFLQAPNEVSELGPAMVRGVKTTHYKTVVELDEALDQAPSEMRASLSRAIEASGAKSVPVDAWVDSGGLLRRVRYGFEGSQQAGGASSSITVELYDFGISVKAQPPPLKQVADLSDIFSKTSSSSN